MAILHKCDWLYLSAWARKGAQMKNSKILRSAAPLFAACFAVLSCGVAGCTQGSDNPPPEEKDYADVSIFMGQSNMAGRGDAAEAIPCGEGHAYEFRAVSGNDEDGWLYPLAEPFGAMENNQALSDGNNGDGKKSVGMTSAFCEAYYQSTGVKVIGVSASVGGTAISSWLSGTDYFEEAKRRLDACIEYAEGEGGMSVRHINMVWCQGESDAGNQQYTEQLKSILEGLRSSFVECCFIITPSEYDSPYATVLADSQIALCEEDDDFVLASIKFRNVPENLRDDPHFYQGVYNVAGWDAGTHAAQFISDGIEPECLPFEKGEDVQLAEKFGITLTVSSE